MKLSRLVLLVTVSFFLMILPVFAENLKQDGNRRSVTGGVDPNNSDVIIQTRVNLSGDTLSLSTDRSGSVIDEVGTVRTINKTPITATIIGDTTLVASQGVGNKIRVLALYIRSAAAVTAKLKTAGNNLSADYALGINDDLVLSYLAHGWFQTNANEALVVNLSLGVSTGIQIIWIIVQ